MFKVRSVLSGMARMFGLKRRERMAMPGWAGSRRFK